MAEHGDHGGTPWGWGRCRDDCWGLQEDGLPFTTALPLPAAPRMPPLQPHHSPRTWGYGGSGRCSPPWVGVSRAQEPLVRPHSRTQPHTNGFCSPQPFAGGSRGWCGRWCHEAALPRPHPVPIPSPSRPHPVPIPSPCQGRTAVTRRSGSRRGRVEGGRLDKARTEPSPEMSSRLPLPRGMRSGGVGSTGGAPMSNGHPSGICSCVGSLGPGGERSHQLPSTPKPDPPPAPSPDPTLPRGPAGNGCRPSMVTVCPQHCRDPMGPQRWAHRQLQVLQPGGEQRPHSGGGGEGQRRAQRLQRAPKNPQFFISSSKARRRRCREGLCAPRGWELGVRTDGDTGPPAQHCTQPCSKAPTVPGLRGRETKADHLWTTNSFRGFG